MSSRNPHQPCCSRRRPAMNASVVAPLRWRHHSQAVTESIRPHHGEDHRGCAVTPPGCWHTEADNLRDIICTADATARHSYSAGQPGRAGWWLRADVLVEPAHVARVVGSLDC